MESPPWTLGEDPDERAARQAAYERLALAARRVGMPLATLRDLLGRVADNEVATRHFLAEQVYDVPDSLLDDLIRVRLADLAKD